MRLAGKIPGIGALEELWTFECRPCGEAITKTKSALTEDSQEPELEAAK